MIKAPEAGLARVGREAEAGAEAAAPAVAFQEVLFAWPGAARPCLDVPTFRIEAGERVFLHGPSGSGKSTLLSLVGGVLAPARGRVSVLGQDLAALRAGARDRFRADHVGFIFQLFNLIPYLSALDNIVLPCRFSAARRKRVTAAGAGAAPHGVGAGQDAAAGGREPGRGESAGMAAVTREAVRLAGRLDLDREVLARPAAELSVGQQQRVAAARALIGAPGLVIADEPTSALDADRQRGFLDLLIAECTAAGAGLLFVSHDARLAEHFDRVLALSVINRAAAPEAAT